MNFIVLLVRSIALALFVLWVSCVVCVSKNLETIKRKKYFLCFRCSAINVNCTCVALWTNLLSVLDKYKWIYSYSFFTHFVGQLNEFCLVALFVARINLNEQKFCVLQLLHAYAVRLLFTRCVFLVTWIIIIIILTSVTDVSSKLNSIYWMCSVNTQQQWLLKFSVKQLHTAKTHKTFYLLVHNKLKEKKEENIYNLQLYGTHRVQWT